MADIRLIWNPKTGYCDWSVVTDDIDTTEDLETAVLLSIFTDARAPDSQQVYSKDKRGWWGTTYNPSGQTELGSRLWTLERAIKSDDPEVLRQAEGYVRDALAWLIADGIAATVTAAASWLNQTNLGIYIVITQPSGNVVKFSWAWSTL
jgi:phage gp46-like protein